MLAILDLARSSPDDVDADPGARAAWDFAHGSAPPRPGEAVTLCRFVVDRNNYQGPSPTLNAVPILTLQKQLSTPNLSWDFVALAEPDRWDEYFAAGDLPRAEGADFTVGGRRYGLFAHDFRKVPVDAWIELWTERALAQDVDVAPREHAAGVSRALPSGLRGSRPPRVQGPAAPRPARAQPARCEPGSSPTAPDEGASGAAVLEAVLREAATTLADHPRDDKLLRAVDRTYLRPAATQEAAAAALGLPFSTYRRHLTQGMTRIVSVLWDQEVYGQDRAEVSTS